MGRRQDSMRGHAPALEIRGQTSAWRKLARVKIFGLMKRQSSLEALYALLFAVCVLLALLLLTA